MFAIDIETASPDKEPQKSHHFRDTSYFELVAVAAGVRDDDGDIETHVIFREGGWGTGPTLGILRELDETPYQMGLGKPDEVLTYNGTRFDEIHLRNWADHANDRLKRRIHSLFDNHIDLSDEADGFFKHNGWSLEDVCETAGIEVEETYYSDYDLPQEVIEQKPDEDQIVTGEHLGGFLGEQYVKAYLENAGEDYKYTRRLPGEYGELQQMIMDYAKADIKPLFELYDRIKERRDSQANR